MVEVQVSEAGAQFAALLSRVETGETVVIVRDGRAIARLVPDSEPCRLGEAPLADRLKAVEAIEEMRRQNGRATIEEMLAWRHEGHRY